MISSWHEPLFQNNLIIPKIIRGSALLEISSPVQVKNSVSVYIDRDSDRDSVRDRDKNNREKNYIDRVRDAK